MTYELDSDKMSIHIGGSSNNRNFGIHNCVIIWGGINLMHPECMHNPPMPESAAQGPLIHTWASKQSLESLDLYNMSWDLYRGIQNGSILARMYATTLFVLALEGAGGIST